jgi:pteridine reductase
MKTILITGGSKRLGKALVENYAASGWKVLFTARYSFEDGVYLARELSEKHGVPVICTRGSVSDRTGAASIANWVRSETPSLDVLVCNASTFKRIDFQETMQYQFDELLGSNLLGPYFLAQQCEDLLTKAGGCIVNIADAQVKSGLPGFSAYLAAKAGLVSITKSLALELAPRIRVNAVLPGSLPWPEDETYGDSEIEAMTSQIPMKRTGDWGDIVGAVEYLASAPYVTGACLNVDGGRSACY